jgi:hypothetical protein
MIMKSESACAKAGDAGGIIAAATINKITPNARQLDTRVARWL